VDRYLEFVAGRSRPNTLRAVAFDLKTFFAMVGKDPVEVTAVDVFDFWLISAATAAWCGWLTASPGCRPARSPGGCRRPRLVVRG
jgi:integrase/recombinase XerD